ncbi:hypothetical protein CISG_07683 [Coccidioides immitis RMSCC 3703]|uniref:DUF803 domain membrane protein n=1 Tax=Coccidioides immitis RMSCC 3703 TaxID=454286 RepID=A0A0J8TZ29_COCIT|nr:hypothetical protein CISG_07683 [Coccidioides immitis RMSCC 3703]
MSSLSPWANRGIDSDPSSLPLLVGSGGPREPGTRGSADVKRVTTASVSFQQDWEEAGLPPVGSTPRRRSDRDTSRMLHTFFLSFFVDSVVSNSPLSSSLHNGTPGNGGDDGGGRPISEWSSTIGIVTAIVGNVLISFALNIQRYAHIRIARELERKRIQDGWKQRSSAVGGPSGGTYGTVSGINEDTRQQLGIDTQAEGQNNTSRASCGQEGVLQTPGVRPGADGPAHRDHSIEVDDTSDDGADRLKQSFLSERTVTSLEKTSRRERKSYLRSPYWWTGIILMTIGEAGNFLAYGFAPASIVSPLGVVALISNCVIAPIMLKEKFRQRDFWGVLVAVGGAVTVVLSANTSEGKIGPGDIMGMITRWEFELYLGLTVGMILFLMWMSKKHGRKTILVDVGLVGLFGGYTALSTKGVSSLLSYTLWHVITFPITYALVAILIFSAMMQIRYINRALQRFDSTQVIPTQFVLFTISVIVGSAILYRDFESATLKQGLQFIGGCALTFLGVYLITSGRSRSEEDRESDQDEEEAIGLLHGTRYRDSVDWQHRGASEISGETDPAGPVEQDRQSRRGSLLSEHDVRDEDEETLRTPRAPLSSSPDSLRPSISDTSILEPSEASPELHITNPWIQRREDPNRPPASEAHPGTPPPRSSVILQFPTAPGVIDSPRQAQLMQTPKPHTSRAHSRRHTISRPPTPSSRSRLSLRFSPGPLLPPLSSGLSAVVAESLRRGEGSPEKRRRRKPIRNNSRWEEIRIGKNMQNKNVDYGTDTSLFGEVDIDQRPRRWCIQPRAQFRTTPVF